MKIRQATEEDISQINRLKGKDDPKRYLKRIQETRESKASYLVIEDKGEILGHVFLKFYGTQRDPDHPNMEDLYVRKDLRGQGIGTKLTQECERITKGKGFNKIGLSVNPILNPKAKALYKRLGYKDTGREPHLDGVYDGTEDWCIDMVKDLLK